MRTDRMALTESGRLFRARTDHEGINVVMLPVTIREFYTEEGELRNRYWGYRTLPDVQREEQLERLVRTFIKDSEGL